MCGRRSLERRAKERDMPVFLTAPKDLQRTPAYDELLRACLVSNRVGLGGAKSASPIRRTVPRGPFLRGSFLSLRSVSTEESYRDRSSAYATTPKRFNPHPYQTGSKRSAPARLAPLKLAILRSAPISSAWLRLACFRLVPIRFVPRTTLWLRLA